MAEKCTKLSPNMIDFCEEYLRLGLIDRYNATKAYLKVYSTNNPQAAGVQAHRLLKKPKIQEYIERRKKQMAEALEITPERTLRAFARRAYFDVRKAYDGNGNLKHIKDMDRDTAACVVKVRHKRVKERTFKFEEEDTVKILEDQIVDIEFCRGSKARDALAKFDGLYEKDNDQKNMALLHALLQTFPENIRNALQEQILARYKLSE